jgi:hypothetical protein
MKSTTLLLAVVLSSVDVSASNLKNDENGAETGKRGNAGELCLFSGAPPFGIKYTTIRKLKMGKGSYGSVTDILPGFAEMARAAGADAVINYTGSQRFGFWPWRLVHPVVRGEAISWSSGQKPNCAEIGGTTVETVIASRKPPAG